MSDMVLLDILCIIILPPRIFKFHTFDFIIIIIIEAVPVFKVTLLSMIDCICNLVWGSEEIIYALIDCPSSIRR